jgi:YesN/AraC family two-component response regulator
MKLYIQNMVCLCCKMTVASELKKMDLKYTSLELGEVSLAKPIHKSQFEQLSNALHVYGLELMNDKKAILVEKIVAIIIHMIYISEEVPPLNFSVFLTNQLNQDYHALAALFSKIKGVTIEHFIILHKIERAKELIMYDELNLTEISYKLNYSSVGHLSNQFKKITGLTPTSYKEIEHKKRSLIENL